MGQTVPFQGESCADQNGKGQKDSELAKKFKAQMIPTKSTELYQLDSSKMPT